MGKTIKFIILIIVLLGIAGGIIFGWRYTRSTKMNDEMVYGNSAGNFYNGGLFCEANGYVYFSNPQDDGNLYRMSPDGGDMKKLCDNRACYINADSHYVYFAKNGQEPYTDFNFLSFNTNSLCRIPESGGKVKILDEAPALYVTLVQNVLYYIHYDKQSASTLYSIGIDGKNKHQITEEPLLLSAGQSGTLCYAGVDNEHDIHLWNSYTDTGSSVLSGVYYHPIDVANRIYFIDCANNYTLNFYDKNTSTFGTLADCWVDCYNITDQYAYYQKNDGDNSGLYRVRLDGGAPEELVVPGVYTAINVTSRYVYFKDYHSENSFYQTPADGALSVRPVRF